MGFDLTNSNDEYLRLNIQGWNYFLRELYDLGWQPQGTVMNETMAEDEERYRKNPCKDIQYTFWMEDKDGPSFGESLHLEKRLTPEQIEDIKNNPDEYFDIDTDVPFGMEKPYWVGRVVEKLPEPVKVKTKEEIMSDWSGGYMSNSCQVITEVDGRGIAAVISHELMRGRELFPGAVKSKAFKDAIVLTNNNLIRFFQNAPVSIG